MHRAVSTATLAALGILATSAAWRAAPAQPRPADSPPPATTQPTRPVLSLQAANAALEAGLAAARTLDAGGAIAVVDDGGHLICLARIDGTFPAAPEVAEAKARTAATFRRPTQDFENAVRSGRTTLLAVTPMTPLEGGVPITIDGQIVGAVGVSGAHSSAEDVQIATAAAAGVSHTN